MILRIMYPMLSANAIKKVVIVIDQPRLNSYEMWTCATEELLAWGESIKPKAQAAFMGFGEYHAGDWCRFCRANGICKAQAEQQTSAFDDFAGAVGNPQAILTPEEISAVLERGKNLAEWFKTVQEKALEMMLNGDKIPGYKVVEGRRQRAWLASLSSSRRVNRPSHWQMTRVRSSTAPLLTSRG